MATLHFADLSPEQREIWQAEQAYWALAKESDAEGLIALAHERVTVWPHFAPAPMDSVHVRENARIRVERFERDPVTAYELSFHAIEVHGDAAIAYYTVAVTNSTTCITHTWIKDRGAWRLAGGMSRLAG